MRYVYNCVKLVLLTVCLGFAGQSSAAKPPIKLDYVEIGGLQFKVQEGKLMFRFAESTRKYIKASRYKEDFCEVEDNVFVQCVDPNKVYKDTTTKVVNSDFKNCSLFNWMTKCNGDHKTNSVTERLTPKKNSFDAKLLCQKFFAQMSEQYDVDNGTLEWKIDDYCFSLNKTGVFMVQTGDSTLNETLAEYLGKSKLIATCSCSHAKHKTTRRELPAYVFPNISPDTSNIGQTLIPLVKALTGTQPKKKQEENNEEENNETENFIAFADLFG